MKVLFSGAEGAHWSWLGLLVRLTFMATLLLFFWRSALTKLGDGVSGLWTPSMNAYAQVFPRGFEAVGYDVDAMGGSNSWLLSRGPGVSSSCLH